MFRARKKTSILDLKFKNIPLPVLGVLFLIVLVTSLFFQKNQYRDYQYELNSITHENVIAPFTFPILKSEETLQQERENILKKTPFVFAYEEEVQQEVIEEIDEFQTDIEGLRKARRDFQKSRNTIKDKASADTDKRYIADSLNYISKKNSLLNKYDILVGSELGRFIEFNLDVFDNDLFLDVKKSIKRNYQDFTSDISTQEITSEKILIQTDGEELIEYPENILNLQDAWVSLKKDLAKEFDGETLELAHALAIHFFEPNLVYDEKTTQKRQKEAIKKVPVSQGIVLENEKIVDANTKVTQEIFRKLRSLSRERAKRAEEKGGIRKFIPIIGDPMIFIGHFTLVGIVLSFLVTFLLAYKPGITKQVKKMTLIGILILFQVILAFLFKYQFNISEYAIPITISAMMLTILFDPKIAFVGTTCISILVGTQIGGDVYFIIISIFVSSFAIYSVRKLRNRSQLFLSIIYIVLGYFFSIAVSELLQFSSFTSIGHHFLYAGINGIVAPFLTYGFIGLIEKPFDLTTDLTLLELADFNHPLLKRLSKNAPGTFAHCIQVGNLAEAAADAVGANALMARVGSYYHDVGKILKPEYFVENQSYISNKHDNLAPNMSALIIINHVKEGQKLAKEYKLPKVVADFIPTHHGTTKVEYFLNRAQNQAEDPGDINEADFEYPGPKPNTKETGIVMIVESVEAACRSIEKPTIGNIIKIIDMIIAKRLEEGQLDNCPLTFSDLNKIKGDIKTNTGILPVLKSIYHLRPEYPEKEKKTEKQAKKNATN